MDKHQWQCDWEHIGEKMFRNSRILGRQCDWCGEAVVELVNCGIECRKVKCAVDIVEKDLAHEKSDCYVSDHFRKAWQVAVESICGWFPHSRMDGNEEEMYDCGDNLVPNDDDEALPDLGEGWLLFLFLKFVTGREFGEYVRHNSVDDRHGPKENELDDVCPDKLQRRWGMSVEEMLPVRGESHGKEKVSD
jgi:hypothetical protein